MGDSYRAAGKMFEMGKSTAFFITHDFFKELSRISRRLYVFRNQEVKLAL